MKTNDTIKVHLYDLHNKEIQTRNYGKTFCALCPEYFPAYENIYNEAAWN